MTDRERQMVEDVLHVLLGRARRIATVGILCFAAGLALTFAWGPRYTATVRLMAQAGQAGTGRSARDQAELLQDPETVARVLPSLLASREPPSRWAAAASRLGLTAPETNAAFAARLSRALTVHSVPGTNVILASLTWADPAFAAKALNLIVAAHQRAGAAGAASHAGMGQAQARVAAAQAELDAVDRQFAGQDTGTLRASLDRTHARLAASRATADQVRLDRALAQQRADALRKTYQGGGWVEAGDADGAPHPLSAGLAALLDRRQTLLAAGQQDSAALRALDREMARAREQGYAAARQIAEGRAAALDDRLAKLSADIADGEAAAGALDQLVSRTVLLTQTRTAKSAELAGAQAALSLAHARLASGWQPAELVSAAVPPPAADWPRPPLLVLLSAGVALAAGLASAARAEALRLTIDRPADLPRLLGIEVLASLGELPVRVL